MKSLVILLIIYTLQNFARSQGRPPIIYRRYPKKVFPEQANTLKNVNVGYKKYNHLHREPFTRFEPPLRSTVRKPKQLDQFFHPELIGDLKSRVKKVAYFSDRDFSRSRRDISNTTLIAPSSISSKTDEKSTTNKPDENSKNTAKPASSTKLIVKSKTTVSPNIQSSSKDPLKASNSPKDSASSGGSTTQKATKSKDVEKLNSSAPSSPRSIILVDPKPMRKSNPSPQETKNPRKNRGRGTKSSKGQKNSPNGQKKSRKSRKNSPKDQNSRRNQKPKAGGPDGRRLIAARDARPEDYPYMISILKDGAHWCSGAILNPQLIITTANCFWKSSFVSRMKVRAGAQCTDRGGQVSKIAEVRKHPKWSLRKDPDCDLALALLAKYLKFTDAVHHVDLPNIAMLPPFDDAWVTSFGAERRDGIFNRVRLTLQVAYVKVMPLDLCHNITSRFNVPISDNFICISQKGRRAPCTRDTGAPAVSDGILWGLASWGIRKLCGTERFPAMFSYTASKANLDFLTNATSQLMSEQRGPKFLDRSRPFAAAMYAEQFN